MSKRFYPQQQGERKKAKLDISISDHNFPLSQNKETEQADDWADDNDDEILLLASQVCEQAYSSNDLSILPDYSLCMQPGSTSTQISPIPSTSKANSAFTFKKPSANPTSVVSTNLKEKCNRISSPLQGITTKVSSINEPVSDDVIFNDKVYQGSDSDYVYRQLLQLQEENAKLKSENGKLLEKCVTKEGEATILRTQLKSCQVAVDNARLEKIKAQEKVQMEWTEKLTAANNQLHDLKTQLDFKNVEIINIKEKCKKLESTKVKLTQVTVANNDISSSNRPSSGYNHHRSMTQSRQQVKMSSNAVQTDDKAHFLALNKIVKSDTVYFNNVLPHILEASSSPHTLLDYNEKLSRTDTPYKCRVYSTFHRVHSNTAVPKSGFSSVQLPSIYENIVIISNGNACTENYFNIFNAMKSVFNGVISQLEIIDQRMTTAFQKEMDEKYIESTSSFLDIHKEDLLKGRALYKEEQEILARRMTAILSYVLEAPGSLDLLRHYEQTKESDGYFTDCIYKICSLVDRTSCATLYSGLLLSITYTIQSLHSTNKAKILEIIKTMIASRPMPSVSYRILELVRQVTLWQEFKVTFCPRSGSGNLKTDHDQGVLLYKKDSCYLQILLKQMEACLKCIENLNLARAAEAGARELMFAYGNLNCAGAGLAQDKSRCACELVLTQVIVYALRICAVMLENTEKDSNNEDSLLSACRCGVQILYRCTLKDVEFSSQLAHYEGHLIHFCEIIRQYEPTEIYSNMLSELAGTLQSTPEDMPPSFHTQPWVKSFEAFSMAD